MHVYNPPRSFRELQVYFRWVQGVEKLRYDSFLPHRRLLLFIENDLVVFVGIDKDFIAIFELACKNLIAERVLHQTLNSASPAVLHRSPDQSLLLQGRSLLFL